MADSRFHLKGSFEVYGEVFKLNMSLNWSADRGQCDERVSQWFVSCYEKAYAKFQDKLSDQLEQERIGSELAELDRLLALYPDHKPKATP